jgi:hypothetical protein
MKVILSNLCFELFFFFECFCFLKRMQGRMESVINQYCYFVRRHDFIYQKGVVKECVR